MTDFIESIADLSQSYDGFLVDLWGVMHDGVRPFAEALKVLEHLRGKPVLLLSNAPRRSSSAQSMLRRIGIDDATYTHILTSGEATWLALRDRSDPWFAQLGSRVYHLGPIRDRGLIEDLDLEVISAPEHADFVVNTGPDDERDTAELTSFTDELKRFRASNLPMICANPDLIVHRAGETILCAGSLAEEYKRLGGDVRMVGKPDPSIYERALQMIDLPPSSVLAIGDSLRTDIAGAGGASIDALWILEGIHSAHATDRAAWSRLVDDLPVAACCSDETTGLVARFQL